MAWRDDDGRDRALADFIHRAREREGRDVFVYVSRRAGGGPSRRLHDVKAR